MHPRNRHKDRYDLPALMKALPELRKFVATNKFGSETIDFSDAQAVKALNRALLKCSYGINQWDIPDNFLCPPIPGRADYIHTVADLIGFTPDPKVRVLDIGTGANCIYPLIGHAEYRWSFVGTDIDEVAVENAQKIVSDNQIPEIEIRLQKTRKIFSSVVHSGENFTFSMCNPPFHASVAEARAGTERKWKNLGLKNNGNALNFGGRGNELWTAGGEKAFVTEMIKESVQFKNQFRWFTTLVSKEENLAVFERVLKSVMPFEVRFLPMEQGQKKSRVMVWSFQRV